MGKRRNQWLAGGASLLALTAMTHTAHAQSSDKLLDALIRKGILTTDEAKQIKEEESTNIPPALIPASKWKLDSGIKSIELFGDFRLRYEYRSAEAPNAERLTRERFRYAVRLGIRGEVLDDFNYGLRLETSTSNPRSSWVTFGDSTGGVPNQGPSSKNSASVAIGQVYIGWKPHYVKGLEVTVGKMPNPLFTTPMVWDPDINPEGAAEKFSYPIGDLNLFATFGQFLYQDTDPDHPAPGIYGVGGNTSEPFILAWQLGGEYKFKDDMSFKAAPTLYNYTGHGQVAIAKPVVGGTPFLGFANNFVGQGLPSGNNFAAAATANGFAFNQTGINDLMVAELPWEFNFPICSSLNGKVFGDFAYNFEGAQRAAAASAALAGTVNAFPKERHQNKAYQIGFAFGNSAKMIPINGPTGYVINKAGTWDARVYWQHTEQYAVDVNLSDSDYFEGRANLEGIYSAFTYNFARNVMGAVRYGYANRIKKDLGTGGSNADLPWINPINNYQIMQFDLTYKF